MLQPLQLQEVSHRYAVEIMELRDFLIKADLPVESATSLGSMVDRIYAEKAFRRDLTSYLWVVIDRERSQAGASGLVGMLAIAAAGQYLAAKAEDRDAHDLLRFVMDVQRAFAASNQETSLPISCSSPEPVVDAAVIKDRAESAEQIAARPTEAVAPEADAELAVVRRRPVLWMAVAFGVLGILVAGLWLYQRQRLKDGGAAIVAAPASEKASSPETSRAPVEIAANPPVREVSPEQEPPVASLPLTGHAPHAAIAHKPSAGHDVLPVTTPSIRSRIATVPPPPSIAVASSPMPAAAPAVAASAPATSPAPASAPASIGPKGQANPLPKVRPVVPALPTYVAQFGDDTPRSTSSQKYPELHRRRPPESADLLAEAKPGDFPQRSGGNVTIPGPSSAGTVRPTSLGTMAGNLLFSPAPPYPAAASAAHVQGEVKIRIEVDRDGSVASASVISGPALLRDAALDAVQRWRYRPYLSGGRPVSTSAIAVLAFELP